MFKKIKVTFAITLSFFQWSKLEGFSSIDLVPQNLFLSHICIALANEAILSLAEACVKKMRI